MWEEEDKYFKIYKIVDCTDKELVVESTDYKYSDIISKGFEEVSFPEKLFSGKEITIFWYKIDGSNDYFPISGTLPLYFYNDSYYILYDEDFDFGQPMAADKFSFVGEEDLLDIRLWEI